MCMRRSRKDHIQKIGAQMDSFTGNHLRDAAATCLRRLSAECLRSTTLSNYFVVCDFCLCLCLLLAYAA